MRVSMSSGRCGRRRTQGPETDKPTAETERDRQAGRQTDRQRKKRKAHLRFVLRRITRSDCDSKSCGARNSGAVGRRAV